MFNDLTGFRQGYLTVLSIKENSKKRKSWLCECDCGNKIILGQSLILGNKSRNPNKSCGCMQLKQKGYSQSQPKLFPVWKNMNNRCHNENDTNYYKYGAKGISVCEEWRYKFEPFLNWAIANDYKEGLTLDRIDGTKGYSPDNCRWVDYYVQEANKGIGNRNTSGYKGVCLHHSGKYRVYINRNGKRKYLGMYEKIEDAARVRQDADESYERTGKL